MSTELTVFEAFELRWSRTTGNTLCRLNRHQNLQ